MAKPLSRHLFVSYNNDGSPIRQKLAEQAGCAAGGCVWQASMMELDAHELPPCTGGEVIVHPVFMQSGYAAEVLLPNRLREAYARRGEDLSLRLLPVWGADPHLAREVAPLLAGSLAPGMGLLVIAHGRRSGAPAPEPRRFADELARLMPGVEVKLTYFGAEPTVERGLAAMEASEVLALPFLAGRGMHYREDMPSAACGARFGKGVRVLLPLGDLLAGPCRVEREAP